MVLRYILYITSELNRIELTILYRQLLYYYQSILLVDTGTGKGYHCTADVGVYNGLVFGRENKK